MVGGVLSCCSSLMRRVRMGDEEFSLHASGRLVEVRAALLNYRLMVV